MAIINRILEDRTHNAETLTSEKGRYSNSTRSLSSEGDNPDPGRKCPGTLALARPLKVGSWSAGTGVSKGWLYMCWEKTANWTPLLLLGQTATTEVQKQCWGDAPGKRKPIENKQEAKQKTRAKRKKHALATSSYLQSPSSTLTDRV